MAPEINSPGAMLLSILAIFKSQGHDILIFRKSPRADHFATFFAGSGDGFCSSALIEKFRYWTSEFAVLSACLILLICTASVFGSSVLICASSVTILFLFSVRWRSKSVILGVRLLAGTAGSPPLFGSTTTASSEPLFCPPVSNPFHASLLAPSLARPVAWLLWNSVLFAWAPGQRLPPRLF